MKAALLISHGSRSDQTAREVRALAECLEQKSQAQGIALVSHAFLDVCPPDISSAVADCVQAGADEVIVLLHFLNSGNHVLKDIPKIIEQSKRLYPDVIFKMTPPVGLHEKMADLFLDMLNIT
ncbi:MAG: CbiX/SirB N-terminal domain-containing protein [Candidatus Omnitrophica bacterium]|nr:CbiX/SirB N-terminal domain-containing protein [Candidatus Omnitrophota bacterium]